MQRSLSTHLYVNQKLTTGILQQIEDAGFPFIEIFCARQHFDYTNPAQVREIAAWFSGHSLKLRSLHAPMYRDYDWGHSGPRAVVNLAEPERVHRQDAVDEVKRALEVAERAPFRYLVQHLGVPEESYEPRKADAARAALESLVEFAGERGVQILLENIPNELSTAARLREFIDSMPGSNLRVCFDTGHAHLGGGVEADFEALRELVASTHVHDNDGESDDHLFPFEGTIDWEVAMRQLANAPAETPLQLELRDYGKFAQPLREALERLRRLEELIPAPREA